MTTSTPGSGSPTGPDEPLDVVAHAIGFIAAQVGGAARILTLHHRLSDGACSGCLTSPTTWPCTIAAFATRALAAGDPAAAGRRVDEAREPG